MSELHDFTVTAEDAGKRLDVYLAGKVPGFSRSRVQKLIDSGDVLVNGSQQPGKFHVPEGAAVAVKIPPPRPAKPQPQEIPLDVLYEDEHLAVINKPAGLVVHPGAGTPDGTLVNALLARPGTVSVIGGEERPGIVHRLDKDTTGLILVARNDESHLALSQALAKREVTRIYWALVLRRFTEKNGIIDAPIGRHPTVRTRMAVGTNTIEPREAITRWRMLENYGPVSLIECKLDTGRTHQIRVHLAHIRHPVLGDDVYGGAPTLALEVLGPRAELLKNQVRKLKRQMLHARELQFEHPITHEQMHFKCDPPDDFLQMLNALRNSEP